MCLLSLVNVAISELFSSSGGIGDKNYGGFDRENWTPRTDEKHRADSAATRECNTKTEKETRERRLGVRYSVFLQLDYYSSVRMCIIDPMHNLFLGTGKQLIRVWQEKGVLLENQFSKIQQLVDRVEVPSDLGRIPRKIASKFSGFTADQMKNLILYFSILAFYDILPTADLECLRKFVLACRILCCKVLKRSDIELADRLLLSFCQKFEELYGSAYITPNMHLHCHLKDCVLDYGPLYSFWLFSFERYNGLLGSFPNNNRTIERQLFSRFERDGQAMDFMQNTEIEVCKNMKEAMNVGFRSKHEKGSLAENEMDMEFSTLFEVHRMAMRQSPVVGARWSDFVLLYECPTRKLYNLTEPELRHISDMYKILYPGQELIIGPSGWSLTHLRLGNELYGSIKSRTCRSAYITAFWPDEDGRVCTRPGILDDVWPGVVSGYLMHTVVMDGEPLTHIVAKVDWLSAVDETTRYKMGKPVTIWSGALYVPDGPASFIPVQRIHGKFLRLKVRAGYAIVPRQTIPL